MKVGGDMSNLLALDQSTNLTGYAYFQDGKLVEYDVIDTSKYGTAVERIAKVKQWMESFLESHEVDHIGMEDTQLQAGGSASATSSNPYVFQVLSKLLGALEVASIEKGIDYTIVRSSEWKKSCGVKGRYRKEQKANAKAFVLELYGLDANQDICDAVCLGYHLLGEERKANEWAF